MINKFKDEGINMPRDTVCRKFKQIGNVSKVQVEDHKLLLQQKELRLKCCKKNKRIKTIGTTYSLHKKKLLKKK